MSVQTAMHFFVIRHVTYLYWIFLLLYTAVSIMPAFVLPRTKRLKTCASGNALLTEFLDSCVLSVALFVLSFTGLLTRIQQAEQDAVAKTCNAALSKLGDPDPDFLAAVRALTVSYCHDFNDRYPGS